MKIYVQSSRYGSKPSSLAKFEGFDKKKYHDLRTDLFNTVIDGMNVKDEDYDWSDIASVEYNIKKAFKMVGGVADVHCDGSSEYFSDTCISYYGWVNQDKGYSCKGYITFNWLVHDAQNLAEDLAMGYFKTTEGADVDCNIYEFVDWILS